jgi:hypothetical protein
MVVDVCVNCECVGVLGGGCVDVSCLWLLVCVRKLCAVKCVCRCELFVVVDVYVGF